MAARYTLSLALLIVLSLSANAFQTSLISDPAFVLLKKSSAEKTRESLQLEETIPLPPVIQSIADERLMYNMHVGKAMDTLRRDDQDILAKQPGE